MARISVILPAYNRAAVLPRAIRSVLAQTVQDFEILVADDASTDGTLDAIPDDSRIRVVRLSQNAGAGAARNAAASIAVGEYFAFLDSDDEWKPDKLAHQLEILRGGDADLVGTGHVLVSPAGETVFTPPALDPDGWRLQLHTACAFHGGSTPLFRREVWDATGPMDTRLRVLEDWDWMLRASRRFRLRALARPLARVHENRPAGVEVTIACTTRFLAKHEAEFARCGERHAARARGQHWENVARCCYRNRRFGEGNRWLWRSLREAPARNPLLAAAFPMALIDEFAGTNLLGSVLASRQRRQTA